MIQEVTGGRRLVFTDLNGTLLRHGKSEPSSRVAAAVRGIHEKGGVLVPVTSLPINFIGNLATSLGLKDLGVLDGGATIYDFKADRPIISHRLGARPTRQILTAVGSSCTEIYYDYRSAEPKKFTPATIDLGMIDDDHETPSIFGIYDLANEERITTALGDIDANYETNTYDEGLGQGCFQALPPRVSKAAGVAFVRSRPVYEDFTGVDIMGLADGDNDEGFLRSLPVGALRGVIGNASVKLAGIANKITFPAAAEDGFAVAWEQYGA